MLDDDGVCRCLGMALGKDVGSCDVTVVYPVFGGICIELIGKFCWL